LFIHAAVSRDMMEPATASFAHRKIGLPGTAQIFDVSNACLGFLNSLTVAAGLIESGQIKCALVVAGENGRPLVEQTIATLLARPLNRNEIKPAVNLFERCVKTSDPFVGSQGAGGAKFQFEFRPEGVAIPEKRLPAGVFGLRRGRLGDEQ